LEKKKKGRRYPGKSGLVKGVEVSEGSESATRIWWSAGEQVERKKEGEMQK